MSRYARGLFFAMEDAEVTEATPEMDAELQSDIGEIVEDAGDISEDTDVLDSAMEDLDALDDISDVMEESVESGEGLDEDAAEIAQIAVESIYRRLGLRRNTSMPSLESFGSTSTRVHATKIAMEGIGETVINGLKAAGKKIYEMIMAVVNFFKKLSKGVVGLQRAAESLLKDANGVKEDGQKNAGFEDGRISREFSENGAPVTSARALEVVSNSEKLIQAAKSITDAAFKSIDILDNVAKSEQVASDKKDNTSLEVDSLRTTFKNALEGKVTDITFVNGVKFQLQGFDAAPGQEGSRSSVKFVEVKSDSKEPSSHVETLTVANIKEIAQKVKEQAKALGGLVETAGKVDGFGKKVQKTLDAAAKTGSKENGMDITAFKKNFKFLTMTANDAASLVSSVNTKAVTVGVKTANAALNYGRKCLKHYQKG